LSRADFGEGIDPTMYYLWHQSQHPLRHKLQHELRGITQVSLGLSAGIAIAASVAWFGGAVYREGTLLAPCLTLLLAAALPIFLYHGSTQRLSYSLLTAALFCGFSLLLLKLDGQTTLPVTFALGIAASAVPFGIDLALKDSEQQLSVLSIISKNAVWAFLVTILPLSIWMLAYEHASAVAEDSALIRTVARNITPQGDTLVFDQINPYQQTQLTNRVLVRIPGKTYSLAEARIESVVTQYSYIIHRRLPKPVSSYAQSQDLPSDVHVSREQAERIRMILPLHGAPIPEDIVLFSRRGHYDQ
jgi:hypothetical protein